MANHTNARCNPDEVVFDKRQAAPWHSKAEEPPKPRFAISLAPAPNVVGGAIAAIAHISHRRWISVQREGSTYQELGGAAGEDAYTTYEQAGERNKAVPLSENLTAFVPALMAQFDEDGKIIYLDQVAAVARFIAEWQIGLPETINAHVSGDHYLLGVMPGYRRSGWDLEAWACVKTLSAGVWYLAQARAHRRRQ